MTVIMVSKGMLVFIAIFLIKKFQNTVTQNSVKGGGGVSYTNARKQRFLNAIPACILLRKNFRKAFRHIPSQKYPCLYFCSSQCFYIMYMSLFVYYRHLKQLGLLSGDSAVWWKAGLGIVAATAVGLLLAKVLNSDKR
jgi:hypothetical protein